METTCDDEVKLLGWFSLAWLGFVVLNATFNNISVSSWRSVLLVEETEDLEKTTVTSDRSSLVTDKLYHIMLYSSP